MLQATFFDDMGMRRNAQIVWSSSDPAVATVTEAGVVEGLSEGQVQITAASDEVSVAVLIGVVTDPSNQVAMVHVTPEDGFLRPGDSLRLTAESLNVDGQTLADRTYSWSSSDTDVVTVDAEGVATAVTPGTASIRVSTEGFNGNSVVLTVLGQARSGVFMEAPRTRYTCVGTVVLEPAEDGGLQLRLSDDFRVSSGPNLAVILSPNNSVGPGSMEIAPLQSLGGAQIYPLPDSIASTDFDWVIIHCVPFNVTFGFAELR